MREEEFGGENRVLLLSAFAEDHSRPAFAAEAAASAE